MSIEDVAQKLYGLAPEDFTAARTAQAKESKAAGDAELASVVTSLRKPTAGAWLLNQLVRQHRDDVQQVLDLGVRLRAAQGTLGADELRALDQQRRQLTRAVAEQAAALGRDAGRRVTAATTAQVEETLRSAMVDPAAGAALSTGLLTDTFSSTGLAPVDLSRVVALPPASPTAPGSAPAAPEADDAPDPDRERRLAEAERAVAEADAALRTAQQVSERAREETSDAQGLRERLESEREEIRRRLHDLDGQVETAAEAADSAARVQDEAERQENTAAATADRMREQLEALLG